MGTLQRRDVTVGVGRGLTTLASRHVTFKRSRVGGEGWLLWKPLCVYVRLHTALVAKSLSIWNFFNVKIFGTKQRCHGQNTILLPDGTG